MRKIISGILVIIIYGIMIFAGCDNDSAGPDDSAKIGWAIGTSNGGYGTILHTQDGGSTWIRQGDSLQLPDADFNDICIIDKNKLLVVGNVQSNGTYNVFKSVDGGITWALSVSENLENLEYAGIFALNENSIWIVGEEGSIYYSPDFADSWLKIEVPAKYQKDRFNRIAAKNADDIWVVGTPDVNDSYGIMLHTTDGGTTWKRLNPIKDIDADTAGTGGYFLGIKVFGNSVWALGGPGGWVIRSADNGTTWKNITVHVGNFDANDIFPLSEIKAYVVMDYGQIYSTDDAGLNWTQYNANTGNWVVGLSILDNTDIWICTSPGSLYGHSEIKHSSDAGADWQDQTPQLLIDNPQIGIYKIRFIEMH